MIEALANTAGRGTVSPAAVRPLQSSIDDDVAGPFRRFNKVCIGKVDVARRGQVPPMTEQLAGQRQVLARRSTFPR
ncbi:MAG: hypothetical protein F4142_00660 [Nitrospira sp. SB0675_bin_23]|nr:hypothetical protein [Nitrospira sp. SB0667_bin_9]MYD30657.1 hypothetical protein [Nitrospira sp. SB0661_bin_20]MYH01108.1 hypothetical protein [Nitrospira sp. SB0675_bin_23]